MLPGQMYAEPPPQLWETPWQIMGIEPALALDDTYTLYPVAGGLNFVRPPFDDRDGITADERREIQEQWDEWHRGAGQHIASIPPRRW